MSWILPLLAVVVLALPALQLRAPLLASRQWSVADLGREAVGWAPAHPSSHRPELKDILHQAQKLQHQFGGTSRTAGRRLDWALALAALIPVAALLGGICALACLALALLRSWRWLRLPAAVGLVSTCYSALAAVWMTHVARTQAESAAGRAAAQLGSLLGHLNLSATVNSLTQQFALQPSIGLYLLILLFAAMVLWPAQVPAETEPARQPPLGT